MFRLTKLMRSDLMIFNVHVFSPGPFKGGDFFINMSDARSQSLVKVMFPHIAFHYMNTRTVALNHFY